MTKWGATQAKAHFSAVLDKAEAEGPQLVERRKRRFLIVTEDEFNGTRASNGNAPKPFVSAWELLRPPEKDIFDFDLERPGWKPREIDL